MDADWFVDPLSRYDGRFFDGSQWTDQVSSNGQLQTDPDWPPAPSEADELENGEPDSSEPADGERERREPVSREPEAQKPPTARGGMLVPERRDGGDRRQINTPRHNLPERRKGPRRTRTIVIPKA